MVDGNEAQLYTIEGVAAAILMVVTAYLILNSTYILTPGDTHISDMQLEQLGNDILKVLDTSLSYNDTSSEVYNKKQSNLEFWLSANPIDTYGSAFNESFQYYANISQGEPPIKLIASVYWWDDTTQSLKGPETFWKSSQYSGRGHYVTISKWVHLNNPEFPELAGGPKTVLLEVVLWRD